MNLFGRLRRNPEEDNQDFSTEEIDRVIAGFTPLGGLATSFIVARTVTREECPWLSDPVEAGSVVYRFTGQTYGACGLEDGLPVSEVPDEYPYIELPRSALIGEVES